MVILHCGTNIPSFIAMGWPIQEVYGFWVFNHTGSRVSTWIIFTVKLPFFVELANNWWCRRDEQRILRVVFECGKMWSHSFMVQFISYIHIPNTKGNLIFFPCSMLFYQIRLGVTSWYKKPMPVIFPIYGASALLYIICNFIGTIVWKEMS